MIPDSCKDAIYNIIVANKGVTIRSIAAETGIKKRTVAYVINSLELEGLIRRTRDFTQDARTVLYLEVKGDKSKYQFY